MFEAFVHENVWKELPTEAHAETKRAIRMLAASKDPRRYPAARAIAGSKYPGSFRLRVGRYRLLFIVFQQERSLAVTTGFLKRRDSDYDLAIQRHDQRVMEQE